MHQVSPTDLRLADVTSWMYGLLGGFLGLHGRLGKGTMLLYILVVILGWDAAPLLPNYLSFPPAPTLGGDTA